MAKTFIVSLGGSLIVPNGGINVSFLKEFKKTIINEIGKGNKFFIVTGGGSTCRHYQKAAEEIGQLTKDDLDWLGIHSTRLNAHLLRTIFRHYAHPRIITSPFEKETVKEQVVIAAGYRPGRSTDWIATQLAKEYGAKTVINLSNIPFVFDKDPNKFSDAKPYTNLNWEEFRSIVGNKWDPGLNLPFDPIAAKLAHKLGLKVVIMDGRDLSNFKNFLEGKRYKATTIS